MYMYFVGTCRCRILVVTNQMVKVLYVDHNDTITVTRRQLRPLPPQFNQLPYQVT